MNTHFGNTAITTTSPFTSTGILHNQEQPVTTTSLPLDDISSFPSFQKDDDALQALTNATTENNHHFINLATKNTSLRQKVAEIQTMITTMKSTLLVRNCCPTSPWATTPPPSNIYWQNTDQVTPNPGGGENNRGQRQGQVQGQGG